MSDTTANQIRALATFLKGFTPLWETVEGHDRLVFLAPQLIARYKDLLRSPNLDRASSS
jgi:hypothetical protein